MEYWRQFESVFKGALEAIADRLEFLGSHKYAGAIILLTLVVRTLLLPLAVKQVRSSQAMQRLAPEMTRLRQKHRDDPQKMNAEMFEMYRREGVNPYASCLPTLAQAPVFIAMFYAIRELNKEVTYMAFLGLGNLADAATKSAAGWILVAIMVVSQYASTKQIVAGQDPNQARIMKMMPFLFVIFMINFPAALVLYWATSNVFLLLQQTLLLRGRVAAQAPQKGGKAADGARSAAPRPAPKAQAQDKSKQRPRSRPPVRTKPRSKRR